MPCAIDRQATQPRLPQFHQRHAKILTWYYFIWGVEMDTTVTSKGQVTIPKAVRQTLGIRKGTRVRVVVVDDHAELRLVSTPVEVQDSGFGLLESTQPSVVAGFDPASLLRDKP